MNNNKNQLNSKHTQSHHGDEVPKAKPQGEKPAIKEGDPKQQRPQYGADGGQNISSRADQLPELDNRGKKGNDADKDEMINDSEGEIKGSDADRDRGGEPSI